MSMSMRNAIGSANQSISQFMFLGTNEWALADAATLNLLASGTTSVNLAAGVTGGFAAPGVFLGLSGPTLDSANAFAFQINANTGALTTYDLPSDFAFLTSFIDVVTSAAISSTNPDVWVGASSSSNRSSSSLLNLSQICGLVSGGVSIIPANLSNYITSLPVITPSSIYVVCDGGFLYSIDIATGAATVINYSFTSVYPSPSGAIGVYIFVLDNDNNQVLLFSASGVNPYTLDTAAYPAMITPQNVFAFGDNLFLLNYTNNQAQSVNLADPASPQFSPVFPLDLSSSGTAPGFSWMDPSTGVYYQNVSGASTFANLSPMQF